MTTFAQLKNNYQKLQLCWGEDAYQTWMAQELNNAHLALVATYNEKTSQFQGILQKFNNNIGLFYEEVKRLSELSDTELAQYWQGLPSLQSAKPSKYDACMCERMCLSVV